MTQSTTNPVAFDAESVNAALRCAVQAARRQGIEVAVAVVDSGGVLTGFQRMSGSFLASVEYAQWKAWTAVSFGKPTDEFGALLDGLPGTVAEGLVDHPRVTRLPGGYPIRLDDKLIGGIGVSGGNGEQDMAIARAGLEAFESAGR